MRGHNAIAETSAVIQVVHPRPIIEVAAPRSIQLGRALHVSWRIQEALRAELVVAKSRREIETEGALDLRPVACGALLLKWLATGPGGSQEKTISVDVLVPPVVFEVPDKVSVGPGEGIIIRYRVMGAVALCLEAMDHNGAIPCSGRIERGEVFETEWLKLIATGHDGRRHAKTIIIDPVPHDEPIDDFLLAIAG
jgi:hypothetical protein